MICAPGDISCQISRLVAVVSAPSPLQIWSSVASVLIAALSLATAIIALRISTSARRHDLASSKYAERQAFAETILAWFPAALLPKFHSTNAAPTDEARAAILRRAGVMEDVSVIDFVEFVDRAGNSLFARRGLPDNGERSHLTALLEMHIFRWVSNPENGEYKVIVMENAFNQLLKQYPLEDGSSALSTTGA